MMKKVEVIKVYYPNNVSFFPVGKVKVGLDKDDKRNYYLVNGKPVLKDGQFEVYFENGNLWFKGFYQNGLHVGMHQYFSPDGEFSCLGVYKSNGERFYTEYQDLETGRLFKSRYKSGKKVYREEYDLTTGELIETKVMDVHY